MRKSAVILILITLYTSTKAQKKAIDRIDHRINKATSDTHRVNLKNAKLKLLSKGNPGTAIAYGNKLIAETKQIPYPQVEASAQRLLLMRWPAKKDLKKRSI